MLAAWGWVEYLWEARGGVWMRMRSFQDGICPAGDEEVDVVSGSWSATEARSVSRCFGWAKWWTREYV